MGQPTQRATNYTARSNIDTAQIFLHANGQRPKRAMIRQRSRRRQRRGEPHTEHGLGVLPARRKTLYSYTYIDIIFASLCYRFQGESRRIQPIMSAATHTIYMYIYTDIEIYIYTYVYLCFCIYMYVHRYICNTDTSAIGSKTDQDGRPLRMSAAIYLHLYL